MYIRTTLDHVEKTETHLALDAGTNIPSCAIITPVAVIRIAYPEDELKMVIVWYANLLLISLYQGIKLRSQVQKLMKWIAYAMFGPIQRIMSQIFLKEISSHTGEQDYFPDIATQFNVVRNEALQARA